MNQLDADRLSRRPSIQTPAATAPTPEPANHGISGAACERSEKTLTRMVTPIPLLGCPAVCRFKTPKS